ncbi:MAG: RDD family protein [Bacteroidia bacterium]
MNTFDENENAFDELKEKLEQAEDYTEPASSGKRFANYIIDLIVWYLIAMVFMGVIIYSTEDQSLLEDKAFSYIVTFMALLSYYIFFESLTSQTIGKMITKTKVINEQGGKPTFMQIVGRSFARLIPFEAFSFLRGGSGWHDTLPGTKVVNTESKKIDELV